MSDDVLTGIAASYVRDLTHALLREAVRLQEECDLGSLTFTATGVSTITCTGRKKAASVDARQ